MAKKANQQGEIIHILSSLTAYDSNCYNWISNCRKLCIKYHTSMIYTKDTSTLIKQMKSYCTCSIVKITMSLPHKTVFTRESKKLQTCFFMFAVHIKICKMVN